MNKNKEGQQKGKENPKKVPNYERNTPKTFRLN